MKGSITPISTGLCSASVSIENTIEPLPSPTTWVPCAPGSAAAGRAVHLHGALGPPGHDGHMKTAQRAISSITVPKTTPAVPPGYWKWPKRGPTRRMRRDRTVGFLAVTAEESGLLGSKAYVSKPAFPMNRTVAGINMDGLNFRGKMSDVVVVGYGGSEMEDVLAGSGAQKRAAPSPRKPHRKRALYYRSDHFNFAKNGVPILYAKGGTTDREHGC